ncbi:beta-galactosidase [Escherichia coli]|uniref:Beta-galactosidase n=1 Tax=Escherichia coli TaxID=562 RepID=A0A377F6D6_ECOLX|nr:beta-galactosidase [Escherichia coli]
MAGNVQEKQLRWYNIALMSFITVWGFGGNDSNLLIVFYVQIMPDDFVMQLHRF